MLHAKDASPHVPLLKDIDISISDELVAFEAAKDKQALTIGKNRRLRSKQSRPEKLHYVYTNVNGEALPRS